MTGEKSSQLNTQAILSYGWS